MLICQANMKEWIEIQKLLNIYAAASGQVLNQQKTSIFSSKNTSRTVRDQIIRVAGVTECSNQEKYLGSPSTIGKSKYQSFEGLQEKIWERENNWKNSYLSQAGKEVLLKAVIQAMPTYSMSVFQLPRRICKEIETTMARFWWGHKQNDRKYIGKNGRILAILRPQLGWDLDRYGGY